MHTHLDEHLHTPECVQLIRELTDCRNRYTKWTGGCNEIYQKVRNCLRKERIERTELNGKIARERTARLKKKFANQNSGESFDQFIERLKK